MPNPPIVIKLLAVSHGGSACSNLAWTISQIGPAVELCFLRTECTLVPRGSSVYPVFDRYLGPRRLNSGGWQAGAHFPASTRPSSILEERTVR